MTACHPWHEARRDTQSRFRGHSWAPPQPKGLQRMDERNRSRWSPAPPPHPPHVLRLWEALFLTATVCVKQFVRTLWTHLAERSGERCEDVRHGWIQEFFLDLTACTFHSALLSLGPWQASVLEARGHFQNVLEHRRGTPLSLTSYQSSPPCMTAQLSLGAHSNSSLDSHRLPATSSPPRARWEPMSGRERFPRGNRLANKTRPSLPAWGQLWPAQQTGVPHEFLFVSNNAVAVNRCLVPGLALRTSHVAVTPFLPAARCLARTWAAPSACCSPTTLPPSEVTCCAGGVPSQAAFRPFWNRARERIKQGRQQRH